MLQAKNIDFTFPVLRWGLTCLLLTALIGCSQSHFSGVNAINANVTPIQKLKSQKDTKTIIYIQGKVEKQVPLLKRQAYLISDSTGKIWVITNQKDLREGEKVVIKGIVRYKSIPLGGKEFGEVYLEQK